MLSAAATQSYTLEDRDLLFDHARAMADTPYVLRVKDLPSNEKPREKLLSLGPEHLTLPELVAILWGVGTRKEELMAMAKRTIKEYGDKALVNETDPERLAQTADIPLSKACQIVAGFELGRRFYATHGGRPVFVRTAKQTQHYLQDMGHSQKEQLRGLYLNSRYQVIYDEVISVGSLTSNVVHPREVFKPAVAHGAVAVIVAHNHPSGSLEPTEADIEVTRQLLDAGKALGIDLLDHLILAGDRGVSIMDTLK